MINQPRTKEGKFSTKSRKTQRRFISEDEWKAIQQMRMESKEITNRLVDQEPKVLECRACKGKNEKEMINIHRTCLREFGVTFPF